jgi:type II secretory pathway component PulM
MAIRNPFRKLTGTLSGEWNRMALRERQLVLGLGAAVVLAIFVIGGMLFFSGLSEVEEDNAAIRDALTAISRNRNEYLAARARQRAQEVRIGSSVPQLATELETAAQEIGIQIPETNPRSPQAAGARYLEHNVDVKLRQVDLQQLSRFLAKLEKGQQFIYTTRIGIRRRFAERDKLDVELTATALERSATPLTPKDRKLKPRKKS